ncbi:MAG TPA: hypothetical protein VFT48_16815 [Pyrinomonadaceae bacterium]|nr:hypothetical protein [Pyrinomonadaceae bacterium]
MKIERYKSQTLSLVKSLPETSDAEWLVAVYLSLGTAEKLGYKKDIHARKPRRDRDAINADLLSTNSFDRQEPSAEKTAWLAGHFFNNALFRIVALAEITLNELFEREFQMEPPRQIYDWLAKWYTQKHGKKLDWIKKSRERVNRFKHRKRARQETKPLEEYEHGLKAFEELLTLMSISVKP